MAEVVNLNRFRKARRKAEKTSRSAKNRARHGRPKDQQERERRAKDTDDGALDGKRLNDDDPGEDESG
ncbi:MAG: DUF4169 family protein [Alphaproteobacteria bacterium]|nr:DUF4169 family protein [Alphaproteobacteria bacterium]MDP6816323.1 DUF4169 family protein [Alphaproteobacteria bacterium]